MPKVNFSTRISPIKSRIMASVSKRHRAKLSLLKQPYAIQDIVHQLVLTDDEKVLFVRNFKAGCSTVTHLLYQTSKGFPFQGNISDANDLMRGVPHWPRIEPALTKRDVYRFTMVRHPQARAVSAFRDFFIDRRNRKAKIYQDILPAFGADPEGSVTQSFDAFLAFLAYCLEKNPEGTDPHFRRQVTNVAFGTMRYDKICKIENYADDIAQVFQETGMVLPDGVSLTKKKNVSQQSVEFEPTAAQQKKLRELYSADFEAFEYN
jgi:hypothetical protein